VTNGSLVVARRSAKPPNLALQRSGPGVATTVTIEVKTRVGGPVQLLGWGRPLNLLPLGGIDEVNHGGWTR